MISFAEYSIELFYDKNYTKNVTIYRLNGTKNGSVSEDEKNQSKRSKTDITAASPQTKEPFDIALMKTYGMY